MKKRQVGLVEPTRSVTGHGILKDWVKENKGRDGGIVIPDIVQP